MGLQFEKRKGRGYRARFSKPTVVKYVQNRPTAVYEFYYERPDGMSRTITAPTPKGRFKRGKEDLARELAERRLSEQYGEQSIAYARKINNQALVEEYPDLHQDNYQLVSVRKL